MLYVRSDLSDCFVWSDSNEPLAVCGPDHGSPIVSLVVQRSYQFCRSRGNSLHRLLPGPAMLAPQDMLCSGLKKKVRSAFCYLYYNKKKTLKQTLENHSRPYLLRWQTIVFWTTMCILPKFVDRSKKNSKFYLRHHVDVEEIMKN
jgi:hypothetical protein